MAEFLAMGGYAFFVWSSYAVVAVALLWCYFAPHYAARKLLRTWRQRRAGGLPGERFVAPTE